MTVETHCASSQLGTTQVRFESDSTVASDDFWRPARGRGRGSETRRGSRKKNVPRRESERAAGSEDDEKLSSATRAGHRGSSHHGPRRKNAHDANAASDATFALRIRTCRGARKTTGVALAGIISKAATGNYDMVSSHSVSGGRSERRYCRRGLLC